MRIEALEIDDHILEKLESRHRVPLNEVEEACYSDRRHVRREKGGLYKVFSQTEAGRYLLVVLAGLGSGVWRVATAQALTQQERRHYRRERGNWYERQRATSQAARRWGGMGRSGRGRGDRCETAS